ncbi:hypothetical protein [Nitrososphaera viennensis]|nr:hypothetical protein [Nitrososphaera viennensis]
MVAPLASAQTTGNETATTGNVTVPPGGNVTVPPGGNVTVPPGGNVTVPPGGNVTVLPGNATLTLTPSSINAGEKLTITGSGYGNTQNATLMIDSDTLDPDVPIQTDANGTFTANATIPAEITSGSHTISATDATGIKGSATLMVNEAAAAPSGNATLTAPPPPSGNATAPTGNATAQEPTP